jgi:hypothetical protein
VALRRPRSFRHRNIARNSENLQKPMKLIWLSLLVFFFGCHSSVPSASAPDRAPVQSSEVSARSEIDSIIDFFGLPVPEGRPFERIDYLRDKLVGREAETLWVELLSREHLPGPHVVLYKSPSMITVNFRFSEKLSSMYVLHERTMMMAVSGGRVVRAYLDRKSVYDLVSPPDLGERWTVRLLSENESLAVPGLAR